MTFFRSLKTALRRLVQTDEESLLAAWDMISNKEFEKAKTKLDRLKLHGNYWHRKIFLQAIIDYYQQEYQNSLNKLESIEKPAFLSDPFLLTFYDHKGYNLEELNRYKEAIEAFDLSIKSKEEITSEHFIIYQHRGNAYHRLKKYEKAILEFEKSINLKPLAETYHNLGLSLFALNKFDDALVNFNKAIELVQAVPTFYFNRMRLHIELQNWIRAISDADLLIAYSNYHGEALLFRGIAKCESGSINDGLKDLQAIKNEVLINEAQKLIEKYKLQS